MTPVVSSTVSVGSGARQVIVASTGLPSLPSAWAVSWSSIRRPGGSRRPADVILQRHRAALFFRQIAATGQEQGEDEESPADHPVSDAFASLLAIFASAVSA